MDPIYLDYNATTPIAPEVADAMIPFIRDHFGNPSSSHALGRFCRDAIEKAREQVADLIGCLPQEVYFTSGGTESNNLTVKGIFLRAGNRNANFVTSCFEHPAIKQPAKFHETQGGSVTWIGSDSNGVVDVEQLDDACDSQTKLVSIMHANNEIGTIQPIKRIAEICAARNIPLHTDASQSVGKVPLDVNDLEVDFLTIAGHKLYAPKGIGALYIRSGQNLVPSIHGADHENGVRPGTENVPYIVGLGVAARMAKETEQKTLEHAAQLRDRLEQGLAAEIEGIVINGVEAARLPNTSSVIFPQVRAMDMLTRLSGLCVSTGAACHSDHVKLSDTLKAIGLSDQQGAGTMRISCGRYSTETEIDTAVSMLKSAWQASRLSG